eukprot:403369712
MNYGVFMDPKNVVACINLRNFDKLSQIEIDKENQGSSYQLLSVKQVQIINELDQNGTNSNKTRPKFSFTTASNRKFFEYILDEEGSFNIYFQQIDLQKDIISEIQSNRQGICYLLDKYHTFSHISIRGISNNPEYFSQYQLYKYRNMEENKENQVYMQTALYSSFYKQVVVFNRLDQKHFLPINLIKLLNQQQLKLLNNDGNERSIFLLIRQNGIYLATIIEVKDENRDQNQKVIDLKEVLIYEFINSEQNKDQNTKEQITNQPFFPSRELTIQSHVGVKYSSDPTVHFEIINKKLKIMLCSQNDKTQVIDLEFVILGYKYIRNAFDKLFEDQ